MFSFSSHSRLRYFISELLSYQERKHHDAKITIDGLSVAVETYTHDVNAVTSQDISLARFCDEIYEDTRFFSK